MAFSINQAHLVGNAASNPELKHTPNGTAVCTFSLATNRSVKQGEQWENVATFHRVVVWSGLAEWVGNNLKKGDPVAVEGRIENRSYQDKEGVTKYISEIVANIVIPFTKGNNSGGGRSELQQSADEVFGTPPARKPARSAPARRSAPALAQTDDADWIKGTDEPADDSIVTDSPEGGEKPPF